MDIKANALYQEIQNKVRKIKTGPMSNPICQVGNNLDSNFADMLTSAVNNVNSMQATPRNMQNATRAI